MSAILEPDHALQQWRDQIEENDRLRHQIADRDERIADLSLRNNEAIFAMTQYKAQFEAVRDERDSLQLLAAVYRGKLDAFADVATDVSRTIAGLADQATRDANVGPLMAQLAAAANPASAPAASPANAPGSIAEAIEAAGIDNLAVDPPAPIKTNDGPRPVRIKDGSADDADDLPAFLKPDAAHKTPVPNPAGL